MTKKLTWKLKELPTAEGVASLVDKKIITPEEAREILLGESTSDKEKIESLELMIEFLKGVVNNMSRSRGSTIVSTPYTQPIYINDRQKPYWDNVWMSVSDGLKGSGISLSSHVGDSTSNNVMLTAHSGTIGGYIGGTTKVS